MAEPSSEQTLRGSPVLILDDESERTSGDDAQTMNITAGEAVAEAIRTTLGPKGMDKMLVDDMGAVLVTNDGASILDQMDIEHPAAEMVVEVAESQEEETGDGTTTAVVLAGELLGNAADLLERDLHSSTIVGGYLTAARHAQEYLVANAIEVDADDSETLADLARTAMTGKIPAGGYETFVDLTVAAVRSVADDGSVDLDHVEIETIPGGTVDDSRVVDGLTVNKDPVHANMPEAVEDARIALLDTPIEVDETETDVEATLTDPDQLQEFIDQEEQALRQMVDTIVATGANVVFCQKGIDDLAQHALAEAGVLAVRRAKSSDMENLARATGGTVVSNVDDLGEGDLGRAGAVRVRPIGDNERLFVEDCQDPRSVTVIVRGGTEHVVEGAKRALEDALDVAALVVEGNRITPGGGAPETAAALELRDHADSLEGREQLAVEAFADALEAVPRTIAENSGLDPIDALVELRSQHADGMDTAGLDADAGDVTDMLSAGVVAPVAVTTNAIGSAQEAASMIVRIDDVIAGGGDEDEEGPPGAGGPGGGMGPM